MHDVEHQPPTKWSMSSFVLATANITSADPRQSTPDRTVGLNCTGRMTEVEAQFGAAGFHVVAVQEGRMPSRTVCGGGTPVACTFLKEWVPPTRYKILSSRFSSHLSTFVVRTAGSCLTFLTTCVVLSLIIQRRNHRPNVRRHEPAKRNNQTTEHCWSALSQEENIPTPTPTPTRPIAVPERDNSTESQTEESNQKDSSSSSSCIVSEQQNQTNPYRNRDASTREEACDR